MPLICPHCGSYVLSDTEHNPNATPCSSCHQDRLVHILFAHQQLQTAATAYDPPMPTVDTSRAPVDEVADAIGRWVEHILVGRLTVPPLFIATPE